MKLRGSSTAPPNTANFCLENGMENRNEAVTRYRSGFSSFDKALEGQNKAGRRGEMSAFSVVTGFVARTRDEPICKIE